MNNDKFNQLILDVYKKWKTLKRIMNIELCGFQKVYNFSGYIYGEDLEGSFLNIIDSENIHEVINEVKPKLLVLKSRLTNQEIGIYKDDITD